MYKVVAIKKRETKLMFVRGNYNKLKYICTVEYYTTIIKNYSLIDSEGFPHE